MGITKAGAKAAGKGKGILKALEGYPGIFHHLAGEHAEVSTLMQRIAASSEDSDAREEIFPELRKNLLAHAHAEEQEFYPTLHRFSELEVLVDRCIEEHHKVEEYLDQLDSQNKATKTWMNVFERMMRAVERHVEREEQELFPKAKDLLEPERAEKMQGRFESAEEKEKKRL